jgi:hypothetical protein
MPALVHRQPWSVPPPGWQLMWLLLMPPKQRQQLCRKALPLLPLRLPVLQQTRQ